MGPEAEHIFQSFTFTNMGDGDKYETVLAKFDEHFIPKRNVIYESAKLHYKNAKPRARALRHFSDSSMREL